MRNGPKTVVADQLLRREDHRVKARPVPRRLGVVAGASNLDLAVPANGRVFAAQKRVARFPERRRPKMLQDGGGDVKQVIPRV